MLTVIFANWHLIEDRNSQNTLHQGRETGRDKRCPGTGRAARPGIFCGTGTRIQKLSRDKCGTGTRVTKLSRDKSGTGTDRNFCQSREIFFFFRNWNCCNFWLYIWQKTHQNKSDNEASPQRDNLHVSIKIIQINHQVCAYWLVELSRESRRVFSKKLSTAQP